MSEREVEDLIKLASKRVNKIFPKGKLRTYKECVDFLRHGEFGAHRVNGVFYVNDKGYASLSTLVRYRIGTYPPVFYTDDHAVIERKAKNGKVVDEPRYIIAFFSEVYDAWTERTHRG